MGRRNSYRDLLGKGIEELRDVHVHMPPTATGALTQYAVVGPFEVDYDVEAVIFTSVVPVSSGTNTMDIFNGTVAGAVNVITQFDPDTLTANTPTSKAVLAAGKRLAAGTVLTLRCVSAAADATEDVHVLIRLERVIHEAAAKSVTYGTYER